MKRRLFIMLLVVTMVVGVLPGVAMAEDTRSGVCGENLSWTLDSQGVLTISGTGDMYHFWTAGPVNPYTDLPVLPWYEYQSDIREVVVEEGVTGVTNAFGGCTNLVKATIADSVVSLGAFAFLQCSGLKTVVLPENLEVIQDGTFLMCYSLSQINIPEGLKEIGSGAFRFCDSLEYVKLPKGLTDIGTGAFADSGLKRIDFYGETPEISQTAFEGVTATVYYDNDLESWKYVSTRQNYGGNLTWRNANFVAEAIKPVIVIGDITGDGLITVIDVVILFAHVSGSSIMDEYTLSRADVNGDNRIDILDVAILYAQAKKAE